MRTYSAGFFVLMLGAALPGRETVAQETGLTPGFKLQNQTAWTIPDSEHVRGLAFDGTNYYVGVYTEGVVRKYDRNGQLTGRIGATGTTHAYLGHGVATDGQRLWTSDYSVSRTIYTYDLATNREVAHWVIPMAGSPVGIAYDGKVLWITVYGDPRVEKVFKVSTEGRLLGSFPVATSDSGIGVAVDGDGNLFVSDALAQRIKLYSPDGRLRQVYNFFTSTGRFTTNARHRADGLVQMTRDGRLEQFAFAPPAAATAKKAPVAAAPQKLDLSTHKPVVRLNANGNLILDGQPFFPLGIYSCMAAVDLFEKGTGESFDQARLRTWMRAVKAAGFNMVQSYAEGYLPARLFPVGRTESRPAFLDYAQDAGLGVMLAFSNYLPGSKISWNERLGDLRHHVAAAKDHPALLVWYLADEPEAPDHEILGRLYRTVKTLDPEHPQFITDWREEGLGQLGSICDILAEDGYPIGEAWGQAGGPNQPVNNWYKLSDIAKWQDYIQKNQHDGRPAAWGVVQMHRRPGDKKTLRFPTLQEMRVMTFMRLVKDVKGLFFFTFNNDGAQPWLESLPEHWKNMSDVVTSVHTVFPAMFSAVKITGFQASDPRVFSLMKQVEENGKTYYYLITVNPTCADTTPPEDHPVALGAVTFSNLPKVPGDHILALDEDANGDLKLGSTRQVPWQGNTFSDRFDKLAVHVYKIGPVR